MILTNSNGLSGGILLVEVNRVLRSGGYFAWAAQPVYKHEGNLPEEWHGGPFNLIKTCVQIGKLSF